MRGWFFSSDERRLSEHDLEELADALACKLHNTLGQRVFWLQRVDVAELLEPYIRDLDAEDQKALTWIVWHLFQEGRDIMMNG
jgi:hypothetical protein